MAHRMHQHAFTLLELILVMGLLAMMLAISSPWLAQFTKGRSLVEESRRFLALTRYARNEAASRGVQMDLWIDTSAKTYGLEPAPGFGTEDEKTLDYALASTLSFDVDSSLLDKDGRATISFGSDGAIEESSLRSIDIREDETHAITITRSEYGMGYEVIETQDTGVAK
jgi:prepilin-type N-terminal cleavage/methylation domain-containing protein